MNFSGVSNSTLVGRALRFPLRLIPYGTVLPILQGKLRGKKWIVGSSNHGCWLGSYENAKRELFERTIKEGSTVFDIGANVGFYSLLAAVMVGRRGKVYAFEPLPRNLRLLRRHLELNCVGTVIAFDLAISERSGWARFEQASSSAMGRLAETGKLIVRTASLDDLINSGDLPIPDYLKIDVEGAEFAVLQGGKETLRRHRPLLFLATHGREIHQNCSGLLRSWNYKIRALDNRPVEAADELFCE